MESKTELIQALLEKTVYKNPEESIDHGSVDQLLDILISKIEQFVPALTNFIEKVHIQIKADISNIYLLKIINLLMENVKQREFHLSVILSKLFNDLISLLDQISFSDIQSYSMVFDFISLNAKIILLPHYPEDWQPVTNLIQKFIATRNIIYGSDLLTNLLKCIITLQNWVSETHPFTSQFFKTLVIFVTSEVRSLIPYEKNNSSWLSKIESLTTIGVNIVDELVKSQINEDYDGVLTKLSDDQIVSLWHQIDSSFNMHIYEYLLLVKSESTQMNSTTLHIFSLHFSWIIFNLLTKSNDSSLGLLKSDFEKKYSEIIIYFIQNSMDFIENSIDLKITENLAIFYKFLKDLTDLNRILDNFVRKSIKMQRFSSFLTRVTVELFESINPSKCGLMLNYRGTDGLLLMNNSIELLNEIGFDKFVEDFEKIDDLSTKMHSWLEAEHMWEKGLLIKKFLLNLLNYLKQQESDACKSSKMKNFLKNNKSFNFESSSVL